VGKDVANTYDSFLRFVRFYKIDEGVLGGVSNALVSLGTMRDVGAWAPRGGCVGLGIDLRATPPTDVVKSQNDQVTSEKLQESLCNSNCGHAEPQ